MLQTRINCIIVLFILAFTKVIAVHPVQLSASISPPYTPFLKEYGGLISQKLNLTIQVTDSRMNAYPAKLQIRIKDLQKGIIIKTAPFAAITP